MSSTTVDQDYIRKLDNVQSDPGRHIVIFEEKNGSPTKFYKQVAPDHKLPWLNPCKSYATYSVSADRELRERKARDYKTVNNLSFTASFDVTFCITKPRLLVQTFLSKDPIDELMKYTLSLGETLAALPWEEIESAGKAFAKQFYTSQGDIPAFNRLHRYAEGQLGISVVDVSYSRTLPNKFAEKLSASAKAEATIVQEREQNRVDEHKLGNRKYLERFKRLSNASIDQEVQDIDMRGRFARSQREMALAVHDQGMELIQKASDARTANLIANQVAKGREELFLENGLTNCDETKNINHVDYFSSLAANPKLGNLGLLARAAPSVIDNDLSKLKCLVALTHIVAESLKDIPDSKVINTYRKEFDTLVAQWGDAGPIGTLLVRLQAIMELAKEELE